MFQPNIFSLLLFLSALLSALVGIIAWQRRSAPGGLQLAVLMAVRVFWASAYALQWLGVTLEWQVFWLNFGYFGAAFFALSFLWFSVHFIQEPGLLNRKRLLLLSIVPVLNILLVWSNPWHHLYFSYLRLATGGSLAILQWGRGPAFGAAVLTAYLYSLAGIILIARAAWRGSGLFRGQAIIVLFASVTSLGASMIGQGLPAITRTNLQLTPFFFLVSGPLYYYALFQFRLLDLVPIARSQLIETLRSAVIVLDTQERIIDINPAGLALLGNPPRETTLGRLFKQAFQQLPELVEAGLRQGQHHSEISVGSPPRSFEIIIDPLYNPRNRYIGRMLALYETTRQKSDAEQLRLQSTALGAAANAILISDRQGRILWVNPAFTQLTGYTAEEAIGQPASLVRSGEHGVDFYNDLWSTILRGETWKGEIINRRKDGSLYTEEQTIASVLDENGQITHFIAIKRDISERRMLQQMRENLVHTIVHDLRNPLSNLTVIHRLLEGFLNPEQRTFLVSARQSVQRMSGLVNTILDLNSLEHGALPLERKPVSLSALIQQVLAFQTPLANERGVNLVDLTPADLPALLVDEQLIGRVLQNLVDNSLKFTPSGGQISLEAHSDRIDGHSAALATIIVRDTGPGIPPDLHERLFEKFTTGRTPGRGSGLGLAFCRLAVEAHGGRIWVDAGPEGGAAFTFTLPVA